MLNLLTRRSLVNIIEINLGLHAYILEIIEKHKGEIELLLILDVI